MSGSDTEMKLPSSAVLFLILWKFILMILRGCELVFALSESESESEMFLFDPY